MLKEEDYSCRPIRKPAKDKVRRISSLSKRMQGMNFSGIRILITGAVSGIGEELAISFSRLGADLGLVGRSKKHLDAIAVKCKGGNTFVMKANLTNSKVVHSIISSFIAQYGGIDVLINCTTVFTYGTIETTTMKEFDKIMNWNLRALYDVTRRATPELSKSKGTIINLSTVDGSRSYPNSIANCMAKAALEHFTRCVAVDLGKLGVRCVSVSPSLVVTKFIKGRGMRCGQYLTLIRNLSKLHALRRCAKVQEVVNVILYLSSRNANFISGSNWLVDGGYSIAALRKEHFPIYLLPPC